MKHSSNKKLSALLAAASAWAITAPTAFASNLCPTQAVGVPSRPGAPKWKVFNAGDVADAHVDDPRWNLASGKNFANGGAKAPLETRTLWATENGQKVLYLSFLLNITPAMGTSITAGRDIYVGFKPPAPFHPQSVDGMYPGTDEYSYIFQFHLNNTTVAGDPTTGFIAPTRCDTDATCGDGPASSAPGNFWRVFADYNDAPAIPCSDTTGSTINGEQFRPIVVDPANLHPLLDSFAWADTAVAYWKLDATPTFPTMKNQWVVQLRIPVVPATGTNNMRNGIVEGSKIWFEATADLGAVNRTSVANWPRAPELTTHVCQQRVFNALRGLVHPNLSPTGAWSNLTLIDDASLAPADCGGIALDQGDIGVVFNPGAVDFSSTPLGYEFASVDGGGTIRPNEVVARVKNTTGADITGKFIARFRVANWGAAPFWSSGDTGLFTDLPGAENGVCAAGTAPNCTDVTVPGSPTTARTAMHFSWTLTPTQICQYQVTPRPAGVTCPTTCSCSAPGSMCDHTGDPGVQSVSGGTTSACVSLRGEHQCVMVEVDAPSSNVDFVNRANWNNLEFRHTSVVEQVAQIDVRGLPKRKGQMAQDIYLVVMPRNMPESIAPTTSVDLIRGRVDVLASDLAKPYLEDLKTLPQQQIWEIEKQLENPPFDNGCGGEISFGPKAFGGSGYGGSGDGSGDCARDPNDTELNLMQAMAIMPPADFAKANKLLQIALTPDGPGKAEFLTHQTVDLLGPSTAAEIVPTLDIYAFYRIDPPQIKLGLYVPMTSFSMFTFHDGTPIHGMRWAIDGFKQVGKNIFRQHVPSNSVRPINVRVQSIEDGESALDPSDDDWPYDGCSVAGGSGGLVLIAVGLLFRRRRKQRAQA